MLKIRRLLVTSILALMLLTPLLVLAQDDETPIEEFTSEDGVFTISYPEGWVAQVDEFNLINLYVANSEDLLERLLNADEETVAVLEPGDQAVVFLSFPKSMLSMFGLEMTGESTIEDITKGIIAVFYPAEEAAGAEGTLEPDSSIPVLSEVDTITIGGGLNLGLTDYTIGVENVEGRFFVFEEDQVVTLGILVTYTGEYDEAFEATVFEIVDSHRVNVSAEALEAVIMGEPVPTEEAPAGTAEPGN